MIKIDGHILDAKEEEFNDEFLSWLESKGWQFIGSTIEEEEEY